MDRNQPVVEQYQGAQHAYVGRRKMKKASVEAGLLKHARVPG
jgi:hypothetical protein